MRTIYPAAGCRHPGRRPDAFDYATLCGATEGTGDNNDFCTLWGQQN